MIGRHLGLYTITSQIGLGGMATVYKAHHAPLDRWVALKILAPYLCKDEQFIERFRHEARIAANLSHPHIVTIHDVGDCDGMFYIAMRLIDGENLVQLMRRRHSIEPHTILKFADQIADALDFAHSKGVLHLDVKPGNIMIEDNDWASLTDFGIAHALGSQSRVLPTGRIIGSPEYMSPEQAQGAPADKMSDLYTFGLLLYELFGGRSPFSSNTSTLAYAHSQDAPPPLYHRRPDLPGDLSRVLEKAMAKRPEDRFESARMIVARTREALSLISPEAAGMSARESGRTVRERPLRVFLCHSSGDKLAVRNLYRQLAAQENIKPWLDEEELLPGQDWDIEIRKAVRATDVVIVCLSRASINKAGYVQKEIRFALDVADEQPEGTIFLIPLRLEECKVPERLSQWHWVNWFEQRGYERLIRALQLRASGITAN